MKSNHITQLAGVDPLAHLKGFHGIAVACLLGALSTSTVRAAEVPSVDAGTPINLNLFGANQLHVNYDRPLTTPGYHSLVKALNIWNLRYTGGSPDSFWNWTGSYIPKSEITAIWPNPWFVDNGSSDFVNNFPDTYWDPAAMISCANQAAVGNVQWLCNITTRPTDQPAFMQHLKNVQGYDVRHVEMDNETYFWGAVFGGSNGGQLYADRVNTVSPTVRSLFPDAKIGIVADDSEMWQSTTIPPESRRQNWNDKLWNSQNRTNYDAFVLHHYDMQSHTLNTFSDLATIQSAYLCFPQITLQRAADRMEAEYGDRPIWVTEFNHFAYPENGGTAAQFINSAHQTAWNAFYLAGFILTAMNQPDDYTVLNMHSVLDRDWGLGLVDTTSSGQINACGHIFSHLAHHARKSHTMYGIEPDSNPLIGFTFDGNSSMKAFQAAAVRSDDEATLFIINRDDQTHTFSMSEIFSGTSYQQMDSYIYSANDPNGDAMTSVSLNTTPIWQQAAAPLTPATSSSAIDPSVGLSLNIPAYSMAVVMLSGEGSFEPPPSNITLIDFGNDAGKQNEATYNANKYSIEGGAYAPSSSFDQDHIAISNNSPGFKFYSYSAIDDLNNESFIGEALPAQLVAGKPLKLEGSLFQTAGAGWIPPNAIWLLKVDVNPVDPNLTSLAYNFVQDEAINVSGIDQGIGNAAVTDIWIGSLSSGDPTSPGFMVKSVTFSFMGASEGDIVLTVDNLSVADFPQSPVTNATASIVRISPYSSTVLEMVVSSDGPSICFPKSKTNLVSDLVWSSVGHSTNDIGPFVVTNLGYSIVSGTNRVIYVESNANEKYFTFGPE